ncbi:hypothetical protein ACQP2K_41935 [Microbispora siamensis]
MRVLTEDNELTLALLHLRFRILCPAECTLTTATAQAKAFWDAAWRRERKW